MGTRLLLGMMKSCGDGCVYLNTLKTIEVCILNDCMCCMVYELYPNKIIKRKKIFKHIYFSVINTTFS